MVRLIETWSVRVLALCKFRQVGCREVPIGFGASVGIMDTFSRHIRTFQNFFGCS